MEFARGTEENHEKHLSMYPVFGAKFKRRYFSKTKSAGPSAVCVEAL
jgi:hypothetical protein